MFKKVTILILAALLLAPVDSRAQSDGVEIRARERDLETLKRELAEKRAEAKKLAGREKSVLTEVKNLEERVDLAAAYLGKLKDKKASCQREISTLETELQDARTRAAARRQVLAQRARQLYMHGRLGEVEAFLAAESLPDLASKVHHFRRIADGDRRLIEDALADQRTIAANASSLEKQLAETQRLEKEKKREEQHLQEERRGRNRLLQQIRDQKEAHEQAIREMEQSARQIQDIIDRLEKGRQESPPPIAEPPEFRQQAGRFAQLKGSLPWPVQGKVIRRFGKQTHPKYKTVTFNKGIDIQAPQGTDIRAVAAGRVLYTSWLRGYGKFLILSHTKGYYTLYAHAAELVVAEGDVVRAGDVIARVGDTGSLEGPKLHFEVRLSKEQLDPLTWLK
jgi:septal ring factor EnvC (AmiA/AmiB activator)